MGFLSRSSKSEEADAPPPAPEAPTQRPDAAQAAPPRPEPEATAEPAPDPGAEQPRSEQPPAQPAGAREPTSADSAASNGHETTTAPEQQADPPDDAEVGGPARMSVGDVIAPTPPRHLHLPGGVDGSDREARRVEVIAFANQKGGVAKTTTTLNLAVAFAESGHDVLIADLDPQGNLTMSQGIDPEAVTKSMYDVLVGGMPLREIIVHREVDVAVASIDLAGAEIAMSTQIGRERKLDKAIAEIAHEYDYICIDTPPSLGLLTINALTAADKVIVPVQCEYLSMRGLAQLQNTLEMIRENLNPHVQIEGILPTMLDSRTVHAKEAIEILEESFGDLVFKSRIRKAVKFAEAPVQGSSVLKYDPTSTAAGSYRELAEEVLEHGKA